MHTCGDGAVGLPIDDSKFVDEDGFTHVVRKMVNIQFIIN